MLAQAVDARKAEVHRVERVDAPVGLPGGVGRPPVEGKLERIHGEEREPLPAYGGAVTEMKLQGRVHIRVAAVSQHVDLPARGLLRGCADKAQGAGEKLPAPRERRARAIGGGGDPVVPAGVGHPVVVRPVAGEGVVLAEEGHRRPLAALEIGAQGGLHPRVGVLHRKAQLAELLREITRAYKFPVSQLRVVIDKLPHAPHVGEDRADGLPKTRLLFVSLHCTHLNLKMPRRRIRIHLRGLVFPERIRSAPPGSFPPGGQ